MNEPAAPSKALVPAAVPVLPLRDVVVYPHMVIPLFVGREKSIQALDVAMRSDMPCWISTVRSLAAQK